MELTGYCSSSEVSAREAAEFTGSEYFENAEKLIAASDAVFLTVPDGAIKDVYHSLPHEKLKGKQLFCWGGRDIAHGCERLRT